MSTHAGSQGDASINGDSLSALREAIEAAARRDPDRIALTDGVASCGYGELAQLLERAARREPGPRRALAVGRSLGDVEAILAGSCAGESLLLVDAGATAWERERAEGLFAGAAGSEHDPVLGLCSSGSSGLPKVVELDWESLLLNAASFAAAAGYGKGDVLWCTTPLAHLYCFGAGVLGGLLNGATVLLGKGMLEPDELAGLVGAEEPTLLLSVPFLFRRYIETLREAPEVVQNWRLRGAIAAGEPVPAELIGAWRELTGTDLRSHYGLTEGGQITLADGGEDEGVGRPLDDVEVRIGERGEIAVRRPAPGRPYRIVGQEQSPDGWYETGDLGHLDEAGNLHVTGRADSRINVAGKKVDPAEVEAALDACEGVSDCAVASVEGPEGVEVVAFVCVEGAAAVGDGTLRTQLARQLSPYKLPRRFVRVAEIPRTLTGKVKRGQLIADLAERPRPERPGDGSLLELVRAQAAAVVLGHASAEAIEPQRTFKELGFDSLAAVSLCEALTRASGLRVPATAVFDHPTPAALAAHLGALRDGAAPGVAQAKPAGFLGEPIAIVGMSCRFPGGVSSPRGLWDLLAAGADAIGSFPQDRGWDLERLYHPEPDHAGTSYAREGGFLDDPADFDAAFFGIGPREALAMDPQQRLLLEAAWEALEDAGIPAELCRETPAGVFAGVMTQDYGGGTGSLPESAEGYLTTGLAESVVSGRVAYSLGLEGPAVTVNTACSSSLVALHLACQALRLDECSLALAGGVTVMATPTQFVEFSRQRGLAPDGRCKPFAAAADGTGWSEGVGLLVLERLSDARRNGHRVLATIRGSAINQDGASNGLTAPNGPSQERVIRQALANAGLGPADVDAVEAHGTGTTLGDPIEAGALLATYGQGRERALKLGSVKSNLGHTLGAAGVAGVIKMVQAMRHGVLPKTLHVDRPSPHVDWSAGGVELLTEAETWEPAERPRRAAVSSFGISGTNAHLILEEAETAPDAANAGARTPGPAPVPWLVSAKNEEALAGQADRLLAHLRERPDLDPLDVGFSLATSRAQLDHRAVILGRDREELVAGLACLAEQRAAGNVVRAVARGDRRPAFLFPGQGSQWPGMALGLLERWPAFAAEIDRCEEALSPHVEWSLRDVLSEQGGSWLERLDIVQPALFATMVSLARLWQGQGVRPSVVVGHSQGEIAAAHIAGGLSLDDAARVVALRAKAMAKIAGKGGMLSVSLSAAELPPLLEPFGERVSLAAVNGPASLVLSGDPAALVELQGACERNGVRAQQIAVDYAAHSAQIDDLREELLEDFAPISPRSGEIPFHSTVSGGLLDTAGLDAEYWYRNLRETVLLEPVLRSLLSAGQRCFIEISPHPVLGFGLQETIDDALEREGAPVLATLRRDEGGPERFALALAQAHAQGVTVDWPAFFEPSGAALVELPTYAFQRKRYWAAPKAGSADVSAAGLAATEHPLLGATIALAGEEGRHLFSARLSRGDQPWLAEHAVFGTVIVPATAFVELALSAGAELGAPAIEELTQEAPLILPEQGAMQVQLSVGEPTPDGRRTLAVHSRPQGSQAPWARNATGTLATESPAPPVQGLSEWPPPGAEPLDVELLYEDLAERGFGYGPAFQGLRAAWRRGEEVFAEVELDEAQREGAGEFAIHPALLDAALHTDFLASAAEQARLPFSWSDVALHGAAAGSAMRVRLSPAAGEGFSLLAADASGAPVVSVARLATRPVAESQLRAAAQAPHDSLFRLAWKEISRPEPDPAPSAELCRHQPEPAADPAAASLASAEWALRTAQQWLEREETDPARLALLTQGAIAASPAESPDLAAAAVWGLIRSAQSEHPGRFALIDSDGSEASEAALEAALASEEPQLAIREGRLLAGRLERVGQPAMADDAPWRLDIEGKGSLDKLSLRPCPEASRPLEAGEVRVAVRAAGLNFRDVMLALGLVPGAEPLGGEGAGTVLEIGAGVSDLAVGDRVAGLIAGAFGPVAVADRRSLAPLPPEWSFAEGAAVPVVYLTALYGLADLAELRPGERVLVHAGAGGVGMAAVQLARHFGAEVFATAHPDKWGVLRGLGLDDDHIASSRDAAFAASFRDASGGEGVDVVLNSLAGEFADASLGLLREGGRFLEMGKTDICDPEQVAATHPGISYRAYDMGEAGPARIESMLGEVFELFGKGVLEHAPIRGWDVRRGEQAFRLMSQGRHVGKIVLTVPQPPDPQATVLITGGTGTLGALLARHLVERHGARHLLLVSRSGPEAEGAKELARELEEAGAAVELAACDVGDREALAELIEQIPTEHPLGTVVHAAGRLDDGVLGSLDPERLASVFAPKASAAWHLHELTKVGEPVELVLFSSLAATIGSPGQANYAAANAFLDALAAQRQAEGLSGTALGWGLWGQASGMTGHLEEADLARMRRAGLGVIDDERGLELFDLAGRLGEPQLVATPVDVAPLRAQARAGTLPALFADLVQAPSRQPARGGSLAQRLAAAPEAERDAIVLELVRGEAAAVLGHASAAGIDAERAFKEQGFDSLAAVELRNRLNALTGLRLAATLIFDHPSPAAVAAHLREEAGGAQPAARRPARALAVAEEEPIAIVGIGCRYPGGVSSPQGLWDLVASGSDAISEFPADRGWDLEGLYHPDPDHLGTSYARHGGFVAGADSFDAELFGIGPREALAMDPQQRLLLETAWETLESAGIDPTSLRGSQAGVFAGISSSDYGAGLRGRGELEGHVSTGNLGSVVSGRLAYAFGLEGPAVTIDTACSSSLVAMHLASQALRSGECSLALAGGVTVLASAANFIEFSRQRGLARDGRCKPFAAAADGTGFSDGAGLVLLEPLSAARRNGRRVLATIRGSAVNQDGASNGLSAPNGPSQERVIRRALENAGLAPEQVDAVEAHGTGTALGDPIEAGALLATYGQGREVPLRLGSIKSNIGHTQAAAGVAGVIKMVGAMRSATLPPTLHVDEPTPHVDWAAGSVELLREAEPWEPGDRPRRAGVSSFGISGTNAHLILEQAPEETGELAGAPDRRDAAAARRRPIPWLVAAKSEQALAVQAERLLAHLRERPDLDPFDVGFSLATSRAQLEHRAVLLGEDREELLAASAALAAGGASAELIRGMAQPGRTAFLFTGQGAQRAGMGGELYGAFPDFAAALDQACAALDPHLDSPLRDLVFAEPGSAEASLLDRTEITQPALFAIEVALYRLLEGWGLRPDFLCGHSVGELSAAHVSGVLSLADASALVAARGRLMGALPEGGAMVAIEATEEEVDESLGDFDGSLSIAAVNGPSSVVVSGEEEAALELVRRWRGNERKATRLQVSHAFHSHLMEPMLAEFGRVAEGLAFSPPTISIVSGLSGELLDDEQATSPAYWARQVREPVRFLDGVRFLAARGATHFLELGPDGVLTAMAQECLAAGGPAPLLATALLRKDRPEARALLTALAQAHAQGVTVDWPAFFEPSGAALVELPTYAFQRKRYWAAPKAGSVDVSAAGLAATEHPLLGATIALAGEEGRHLFSARLSRGDQPWLAEHAVFGTVIVPATAFVELALSAGAELGAPAIEELTQEAPLILPEQGAMQVQLSVGEPTPDGRRTLAVHSRPQGSQAPWARNATGTLATESPAPPVQGLSEWPPPGAEPLDVELLYEDLAERGFGYGPAFQGLRAAWRRGEEVFAEVELDEAQREGAGEFAIHPALLDAALHTDFLASAAEQARLPFSWSDVALHGAAAGSAMRVRLSPAAGEGFSLLAADASGAPVVSVARLATRPVAESQLRAAAQAPHDSLFRLAWKEISRPEPDSAPSAELCRHQPEPAADPAAASLASAEWALRTAQQWLEREETDPARLALLTQGAIAASPAESPDLAAAAVWGLIRSAQSEHPGRFALIDSDGSEASEAALEAALASEEPQLAIREGRLLAGRLERVGGEVAEATVPQPPDPQATVLITGGTGTLGALLARHLVERHGARHLLLVSRSGPEAEGAKELARELEEAGAAVELAACDVGDREALAELIEQIPTEHPLGTVVHAAGRLDDGVLGSLDPERLASVFAPKASAAWHLHELTKVGEPVELVLFSSLAATIGSPGQANYAAANAFLDALAAQRQAEGLSGTALGWGAWEPGGMAAELGDLERARIARSGVAALSAAEGLGLFDRAREIGGQLLPVRLDHAALRAAAAAGTLSPPMCDLAPAAAQRPRAVESLARRLARAPRSEHEEMVLEMVRAEAAAVLGHSSAQEVSAERAFKESGFDSLGAVELRNRLGQVTGLRLPSTLVFDHPSPRELAAFVLERAGEEGDNRPGIESELDRVAALLASTEGSERTRAVARLEALLADASADGGGAETEHHDLESASDDEMIELIDREFGAV